MRVNLLKNLVRRRWMEERTAEETAATCLIGDLRRPVRRGLVGFVVILLILDTIEEILEITERDIFGEDTRNGG